MATDFSRDHPNPPTRHRPGPGQALGMSAGERALEAGKGGGGGSGGGTRRRPSRRSEGLGLPSLQRPEQPPPDLAPHRVMAHHANMTDLGRETPFGLWMLLNGHARDLFAQSGRAYPDLLEDVT